MKKFEITNNVTRGIGRIGLQLKKHSPEILVVAGIVGTVTSAVMACKATTKAGDILDEARNDIHEIKLVAEATGIKEAAENHSDKDIEMLELLKESEKIKHYTEDIYKRDISVRYAQAAVKFAKLYAPSVMLGALSLTCIIASNNILRKRNVALAAAYTIVDKGFKEYRGRVVERFGEELDHELRYNVKAKEVEEVVVDDKGKEKVVKKTVNVADPNLYSDYARIYDDGCTGWSKDSEFNLTFLKQQQCFANDKLQKKGYLFLNDVYESLGIPLTTAGFSVGWIYDEKKPVGDNFVDFGIYDMDIAKNRDFVNGYERSIVLDFNVDGNILDLM